MGSYETLVHEVGVGSGNEVAHIASIIGSGGAPIGAIFAQPLAAHVAGLDGGQE